MNKNVKIFIIIAVIVLIIGGVIFAISSILNIEKTPLTAEEFKTKMEEKGYTVLDATSLASQYDYVSKIYVAQKDAYQIEFFEFSNDEYAIGSFNTNKSKFEEFKGNSSATMTVNIKNYSKYSLNTNGKYKFVSRVNNTLIYLDVEDSVQDEVKEIIKELGY